MDRVSMSGNVQGSMDKNSGAPPWRDTGQQMEFPCLEMCRDPWIKTLVPLSGGIWANGWSFHVQKCGVFIHSSLHIFGHGNSICWPVSFQGGAPEFLSTDPCTFLNMQTPSVDPYPSREGHQSFYPWIPSHFQTWKLHPLAHIPPGRGTGVFIHGQWMEFPCLEMCRDPWIKTLEPLPGGIQANRWSFHVQKCVGVCG